MRRKGRPYTPTEDDSIRTLFAAGLSVPEIAVRLGRDRSALHKRMRQLGMSSLPVLHLTNAPENGRIRELCALGMTEAEIALATGLTIGQVHGRRRAMGLIDRETERDAEALEYACDDHLEDLRREHKPGLGELRNSRSCNVRVMLATGIGQSCTGSPAAMCASEGAVSRGTGDHAGGRAPAPKVTLPEVRFLKGPSV